MHAGVPAVKRHTKATHANSTPATDGRRIVCIGDQEEITPCERSRYGDVAATFQPPQFFSRLGVVTTDVLPSVEHELAGVAAREEIGRRPGWHLFARCAPELVASLCFEGRDE